MLGIGAADQRTCLALDLMVLALSTEGHGDAVGSGQDPDQLCSGFHVTPCPEHQEKHLERDDVITRGPPFAVVGLVPVQRDEPRDQVRY